MRKIKVGLIQQANTEDVQSNLEKLNRNIADVADKGAELVVLQELHNSLYFCQTENTANFDLAEPIPGPSTDFFARLAARHGIVLVAADSVTVDAADVDGSVIVAPKAGEARLTVKDSSVAGELWVNTKGAAVSLAVFRADNMVIPAMVLVLAVLLGGRRRLDRSREEGGL